MEGTCFEFLLAVQGIYLQQTGCLWFLVVPCCSQGVTLQVTLQCHPVVCLSVAG